jgi:hypothetical protein
VASSQNRAKTSHLAILKHEREAIKYPQAIFQTVSLRGWVYKGEKEARSYEANLPTVVALHLSVARRVRSEMLAGRRSGMLGYEAHPKDSHSGGRSWRR